MGANITANCLGIDGETSLLSGAVCVHSAIKKWAGLEYFEGSLGGMYNRAMGRYMFDFVMNNIEVLQPHFEKEYGVNLSYEIENLKT